MAESNALLQLAKEDADISLVMDIFNVVDDLHRESLVAMGLIADQKTLISLSSEIEIIADPSSHISEINGGGLINVA